MTKTVRARYTLEFKQEAVRLVTGGQSIAAAARSLGVVEQTLFNWVKADRQGRLKGADSKVVSAEQMEISRLRAELARVKMERDILGKATAAQAACAEPVLIEVRLHQPAPPRVADFGAVPSARGQRGRISRAFRACGQRGPAAPSQRRRAAGARQGHSRRDPRWQRLAPDVQRTAGQRPEGGQGARSQAHAAAWHPSQGQAPLQGHHGQQPRSAGRAQPA